MAWALLNWTKHQEPFQVMILQNKLVPESRYDQKPQSKIEQILLASLQDLAKKKSNANGFSDSASFHFFGRDFRTARINQLGAILSAFQPAQERFENGKIT